MPPAREPRHPLEKRDLLHADPPKMQKVNAVARKLLDEGRYPEAVDYVEVTKDPQLVEALEQEALSKGSPFLLAQVARIRGEPVDAEKWVRVAEGCKQAGRYLDAVRSLQQAGREEDAEALRQEHCPDYEPFKPLDK